MLQPPSPLQSGRLRERSCPRLPAPGPPPAWGSAGLSMRAAPPGCVRPRALAPTPPACSRVRRLVRVARSPGHLLGGGQRPRLACHTLLEHHEQNPCLLFVGLGTPIILAKPLPFPVCSGGPARPRGPARELGAQGNARRGLGQIWGSSSFLSCCPALGIPVALWEFPCRLLPAGSSADTSTPSNTLRSWRREEG